MKEYKRIRIKSQVIKTLELHPIPVFGGGDDIRFRIEILREWKSSQKFQARIWRGEFYRIKPTFPQKKGRPSDCKSDELLWVEDHIVIPELKTFKSKTAQGLIHRVLDAIASKFSIKRPS